MSGWKAPLLLLCFCFASVQIGRCTPDAEPYPTVSLDSYNVYLAFISKLSRHLPEKCGKNGGPTAFNDLQAAGLESQTCFNNLVNMTALQSEIDAGRPTNNLGPVAANLCTKASAVKACSKKVNDAFERCLDKSEKLLLENLENVREAFADFLCFQNGTNFILFFKDEGIDCLGSKTKPIIDCLNSTLGKYFQNPTGAENFFSNFGEQECLDIYAAQECVVDEMYKCDKTTSGKFFEEMFNFINRRISCNKVPKKMTEASLKKSTKGGFSPVGLVLSQSVTPMNATHMEMDLKLLMPRF